MRTDVFLPHGQRTKNYDNRAGEIYIIKREGKGRLTYDSAAYADNAKEMPDLIAVKNIDGISGYIKKADFNGDMPKTTTEAIAQNKIGDRLVPLYASDGKTIIGSFQIFKSESIEFTEENTNTEDYQKMLSE